MSSLDKYHPLTMFYGASPLIMQRAKQLRKRMTVEERMMWEIVRENTIQGLKFRRQHPISNYIVSARKPINYCKSTANC